MMVDALKEVLAQGESLILSLDDNTFNTKIPLAFDSTIGVHYRHTLEHFRSFLEGLDLKHIDYDARKRNLLMETDRGVALQETHRLMALSSLVDQYDLSEPTRVCCKISYSGEESSSSESSMGREVMFCISHAIHHYALIAMMARWMEVSLPEGFGIAPSTIKYRREVSKQNA